MGLLAEFSVVDDLGYADFTPALGLYIDYSYGCDVFASTFEEVARSLVPVDTGFLQSTISASSDGEGCTCEADCDYAEYVEYGTCYMGAQPYFEPAIAVALSAAFPLWDEAVEEAMEEEQLILEEQRAAEAEAEEDMSFAGALGSFIGLVIAAVIIGLVKGFFDLITSEMNYGGDERLDGLKGVSDYIDIEIT